MIELQQMMDMLQFTVNVNSAQFYYGSYGTQPSYFSL